MDSFKLPRFDIDCKTLCNKAFVRLSNGLDNLQGMPFHVFASALVKATSLLIQSFDLLHVRYVCVKEELFYEEGKGHFIKTWSGWGLTRFKLRCLRASPLLNQELSPHETQKISFFI